MLIWATSTGTGLVSEMTLAELKRLDWGAWHGSWRADGTLGCADATGSIHQMGAHVQGLDACNGWTFWQFESKGALVSIDVLRQRLRADLA